ncbi:Hypothetical protein NTJ_03297 [Nesidiocoris tenuis]|uniref:Uncharacterized protein n=1 Tax=Nesidiocoris tenuis TaxID=355587 RepID=A0ABN7AE06_9HEMI|nr:Hypothetical protein NTJ_03297 [Nesidiocoris tenuis]
MDSIDHQDPTWNTALRDEPLPPIFDISGIPTACNPSPPLDDLFIDDGNPSNNTCEAHLELLEEMAIDGSNYSDIQVLNVRVDSAISDPEFDQPASFPIAPVDHEEVVEHFIKPTIQPEESTGRRKRNSLLNMSSWGREESKKKRLLGQDYTGYRRRSDDSMSVVIRDVPKPARGIGPRCSSKFCARSATARKCSSITESERKAIFTYFWSSLNSWDERKVYVRSLVDTHTLVKNSYSYFLSTASSRLQVCRLMFQSTLGLKWSTIRGWIKIRGEVNDEEVDEVSPLLNVSRKNNENRRNHLLNFLKIHPKLPSHYCRADTNHLYLQDVTSYKQLHDRYKQYCVESDVRPLNRCTFRKEMVKQRLSIFQPRKDQCDTCTSYSYKNISEEHYKAHLEKKQQAREEKNIDKQKAIDGECHTICSDLMAVKMIPTLQNSTAYYKLKLAVHNYTIYNMANHDATCYYFDETSCGLEASIFSSCLTDYLKTLIDADPKPVVLYSDGCNYQNRNSVMSNALLHLAMEKNTVITQKYLERGHTQMECDSVHAAIETKLRGKAVFLPSQLASIASKARTNPMPYKIKTPDFAFFKDFSQADQTIYTSIRPGKKAGDPTVTDLRAIMYDPTGTIKFKLAFDNDWQELPVTHRNRKRIPVIKEFPNLYRSRPLIPRDKYNDLQDLLQFIPGDCRPYYDSIPHEMESRRAKKRAGERQDGRVQTNGKKKKKNNLRPHQTLSVLRSFEFYIISLPLFVG